MHTHHRLQGEILEPPRQESTEDVECSSCACYSMVPAQSAAPGGSSIAGLLAPWTRAGRAARRSRKHVWRPKPSRVRTGSSAGCGRWTRSARRSEPLPEPAADALRGHDRVSAKLNPRFWDERREGSRWTCTNGLTSATKSDAEVPGRGHIEPKPPRLPFSGRKTSRFGPSMTTATAISLARGTVESKMSYFLL